MYRSKASAALRVALASLVAAVVVPGAAAAERDARRIIVRFRADGPHALEDCAESLFRAGKRFADRTADGSPSIDALNARVGARRVRALFRRPDGRTLEEQRLRLREQLGSGRSAESRRGRLDSTSADLAHVYGIEIGDGVRVEEAVALYAADPHVVWAQRDHSHALDALPDDPFLSSSGSWGQSYADLWGLHRVRAPEAWARSQGEGIVVAVVDTGLDYGHPDIAENVWVNPGEDLDRNGRVDASDWNGVDDDGNGFVDDIRGYDFAGSADVDEDGRWDGDEDVIDPDPFDGHGHGTHVSGTIAAVAGNGLGIAGVAPRATIMPLKGFSDVGRGEDSVLWRAVVYAAANGARVVNNSWSCVPECPVNPLAEEVVDLVHAMGVVVVTSAGNLQRDVVRNSPESSWKVVTVASSGEDDAPSASFTNSGWLLDLAAPGGGPSTPPSVRVARRNILSLRSAADPGVPFVVARDYVRNAGTSMAAPHVAGAAALLLAIRPDLTPSAVRRILRQSAVDLGPPGHDRYMGAGRLDVLAALDAIDLPDLDAALTGPRPGATLAPQEGPVLVSGRASGADLRAWRVWFGRGRDPSEWTPIGGPSSVEVEDGPLVEWDVEDLPAGAYLLRLDVEGRAGHRYSEFLPLSLEPARFDAVSSIGPNAEAPDVAGRWVVWQSRRGEAQGTFLQADHDLFATDLVSGREIVVQAGPGDQRSPAIVDSPPVVSWLDDRDDPGAPSPWGCALRSHGTPCVGVPAPVSTAGGQAPTAASGRIVWLDGANGALDVRTCRLEPGLPACLPEPIGVPPGRRGLIGSDGRRLVWTEFGDGQRFWTCRLDRRTGACPPTVTAFRVTPWSRAAASRDLLAWVGFDLAGANPLWICRLDAATGDCTPQALAHGVVDPTPDLSTDRLVWDHHVGDEASDVFFCEYDRVRDRCPVQRLTAHLGEQRASAIDGRRVVWEDDREGAVRIYAKELPALAPLADRRVREGRSLEIPLRLLGPERHAPGTVRMEIEVVGIDDPASLGMQLFDAGNGRGRLSWRPRAGAAGRYVLTFTATTSERIATRRSLRIEVLPGRVERPANDRGRIAAQGT